MKRDYCSDCGTTYDTRGLCACTEPDWLRAEVQRLQEQVSRLLDARTIDRLRAHGDGYQDGHRAGQEAMRVLALAACGAVAAACRQRIEDRYETSAESWEDASAAAAAADCADAIRALEVE